MERANRRGSHNVSRDVASAGQERLARRPIDAHLVRALDDLKPEPGRSGHSVPDLMGVVAGVGPNEYHPWKVLANLVENKGCSITVVYAGGVHDHARPQSPRRR